MQGKDLLWGWCQQYNDPTHNRLFLCLPTYHSVFMWAWTLSSAPLYLLVPAGGAGGHLDATEGGGRLQPGGNTDRVADLSLRVVIIAVSSPATQPVITLISLITSREQININQVTNIPRLMKLKCRIRHRFFLTKLFFFVKLLLHFQLLVCGLSRLQSHLIRNKRFSG